MNPLVLVFGAVQLLLGGAALTILCKFLYDHHRNRYDLMGQLMVVLMLLFTTLAGLLIVCRQGRIARWLQTISALVALIIIPLLFLGVLMSGRPIAQQSWLSLGGFTAVTLWLCGFAWFLKKQESET